MSAKEMEIQKQLEIEVALLFLCIFTLFICILFALQKYIDKLSKLEDDAFDPNFDDIFEPTVQRGGRLGDYYSFTKKFEQYLNDNEVKQREERERK